MISVAIVAHPKRESYVSELLDQLDAPAIVSWDYGQGQWATAATALAAYDPRASHHLVLEDDAIPCSDLILGLESVVARISTSPSIISCYIGSRRPCHMLAQLWADEAQRQGACLISAPGPRWGVGLVFPVPLIDDLLAWCATSKLLYDDRIAAYGAPCLYTYPSLVDHRAGASVHGGRPRDRHALVPPPSSALTVDWTSPFVASPQYILHGRVFICWWCGYGSTNNHRADKHAGSCRRRVRIDVSDMV